MYDTQLINKQRLNSLNLDKIWVFGYGSLIYKVDFPYIDCQPAFVHNWERRFWMGSHDHRGTPENPGRVLTLTKVPKATCFGMAYRVTLDEFEHLDHREKNGYLREMIDIHFASGRHVSGLVYIGSRESGAYFGDASVSDIAKHIYRSAGPSGENRDYVFELAKALRKYGENDPHVFAIESYIKEKLSPE